MNEIQRNVYDSLVRFLPIRVREEFESLTYEEVSDLTFTELGLTSMQSVELIMNIEDNFNMEFDESDLLNFHILEIEYIVNILSAQYNSQLA